MAARADVTKAVFISETLLKTAPQICENLIKTGKFDACFGVTQESCTKELGLSAQSCGRDMEKVLPSTITKSNAGEFTRVINACAMRRLVEARKANASKTQSCQAMMTEILSH